MANIQNLNTFTDVTENVAYEMPQLDKFRAKYAVNKISEFKGNSPHIFYKIPFNNTKWNIYRCQLSTAEESCCCSCNSDAMFEVMKSLYDCYKKKNCDRCNCILCGHLPREERKLGELRKSGVDLGMAGTAKAKKRRSLMLKEIENASKRLEGKSDDEKENILKELVAKAIPFPPPKTASEKSLMDRVKKQTDTILLDNLKSKPQKEKEKILKERADIGIPLPEGRTPSEIALIEKVRGVVVTPEIGQRKSSKVQKEMEKASKQLEGKSNEEKEKILVGLAAKEVPFPPPKTASEKILMEKVKKQADGAFLDSLKDKPQVEKEKLLKQRTLNGLSLPEGRTPSEKVLIDKVKDTVVAPKLVKKRSSKVQKDIGNALKQLEGKTNDEKENILRELAAKGIPFPPPKTNSEKSLMKRVKKQTDDALLDDLKSKPQAEKEKTLIQLAENGVILPEGRTPSEKALIEMVQNTVEVPEKGKIRSSKVQKQVDKASKRLVGKSDNEKEKILQGLAAKGVPFPPPKSTSEKSLMKRVKKQTDAALLDELKNKPQAEKEKILKQHAINGVILPKGRTSSEKALMEKVKTSLEKTSTETKKKGPVCECDIFITPLEGKTTAEKKKILKARAAAGFPLPEGKTPSEKALINKFKGTVAAPALGKIRSSKVQKEMEQAAKQLEGKSNNEKEKILQELATKGVPFPSPKTASEKTLMKRVKKQTDTALLNDLKGKPQAEKEKILRQRVDNGVELPEGRTPSEKALIEKVKDTGAAPELEKRRDSRVQKEIERASKELEGKTNDEKGKILRELIAKGVPFPPPKTASEKTLMRKVKLQTDAALLDDLKNKPLAEKEKILKQRVANGIALPEGRTKSEKAIINKVKNAIEIPVVGKRGSKVQKEIEHAGKQLEGKSNDEKEKILQELATKGMPFPPPKTVSEKSLMKRVKKQTDDALLDDIKSKPQAEKEKTLIQLAENGVSLPEGRTPSEKALIEKVQNIIEAPEKHKIKSSKVQKEVDKATKRLVGKSDNEKEKILQELAAKGVPFPPPTSASEKSLMKRVKKQTDAALLDELRNKPQEVKEKILKKRAANGVILPVGRTSSEKALIEKVKTSLDKTPAELKKKMKSPICECDLMTTSLEGKPTTEKKKILKARAAAGFPLPEGRTPSEKAIIAKIKKKTLSETGIVFKAKTASERELIRKAQADGLLTPLAGKSPAQREKILKGLVEAGLPLPKGKSASEKVMIQKIRIAAGLPPEPTPSEAKRLKSKLKKTSGQEKEIPLEAKTTSAKEIIRKAKAEGLLTPLAGKSPAQKEKILKGLAEAGLPLPMGKSASEKSMIKQIRVAAGLPPEPTPSEEKKMDRKFKKLDKKEEIEDFDVPVEGKTSSAKEIIRKAKAKGLLTPLAGKSRAQKEKILKKRAKAGLPLPKGKTPSEKSLIRKVRVAAKLPPEPTASEEKKMQRKFNIGDDSKFHKKRELQDLDIPLEGKTTSTKEIVRKAKAEGLLTPLTGKSRAQKEKILKGLAESGLPLPKGKSPSEKSMIKQIRVAAGLPPEPTLSEEKRIKAKFNTGGESKIGRTKDFEEMEIPLQGKTTSAIEKIRKAKARGLLTPLAGKSPTQKENILKGLAEAGLPLPKGKTASEKSMIRKVRVAAGLSPESTPSEEKLMNKKFKKRSLGQIGSKEQFEDFDTSLQGKTASAKEMIQNAKAKGLLTPLAGKSKAQQEKILRKRAEAGLPLPKGTNGSEKAMIRKVRVAAGLPPEPTPSEEKSLNKKFKTEGAVKTVKKEPEEPIEGKTTSAKEIIRKAKAEGILTPLEGKSSAQKERILKRRAEVGLPLPKGKTASEKAMIRKVRVAAGLPPEPTASEEKMLKKQFKVAKRAKSGGARLATTGDEYQDIKNVATCDKGCGCDKKKIRFRHSYVKIRVTSPDLSTLCPCPNECLPGVKRGVFTDNEGIKVTVGSAVGVPSFSLNKANNIAHQSCSSLSESPIIKNFLIKTKEICNEDKQLQIIHKNDTFLYSEHNIIANSNSRISKHSLKGEQMKRKHISNNSSYNFEKCDNCETSIYLVTWSESSESASTESIKNCLSFDKKSDSLHSFVSLSVSSLDTISIISLHESWITPRCSHYLCCPISDLSDIDGQEPEYLTNKINYSTVNLSNDKSSSGLSISDEHFSSVHPIGRQENDVVIFRMDEKIYAIHKHCDESNHNLDLNYDKEIYEVINEILIQRRISINSSIFVVVSTSDEDENSTSECTSSVICLRLSENFFAKSNFKDIDKTDTKQKRRCGIKISTKAQGKRYKDQGKGKIIQNHEIKADNGGHNDCIIPCCPGQVTGPELIKLEEIPREVLNLSTDASKLEKNRQSRMENTERFSDKYANANNDIRKPSSCISLKEIRSKQCQVDIQLAKVSHRVAIDTTEDRPCCCLEADGSDNKIVKFKNVAAEILEPIIVNQDETLAQGSCGMASVNVPHCEPPSCGATSRDIEGLALCDNRAKCAGGCDLIPLTPKQTSLLVPVPIDCSLPQDLRKKKKKNARSCNCSSKESMRCTCNAKSRKKSQQCFCIDRFTQTLAPDMCPRYNGNVYTPGTSGKYPNADLLTSLPSPGAASDDLRKFGVGQSKNTPNSPLNLPPPTKNFGNQCSITDKANFPKKCSCSQKKNVVCECPYEEPDVFIEIDEKDVRKLMSDMTQKTSGFSFRFKKRPVEEDASFDDVIAYYQGLEDFFEKYNDEQNKRNKKKKRKIILDCECSIKPPEHVLAPEPELKGLKMSVTAKGSAAKGLRDICCFDVITQTSRTKAR